MSTLLVRTSWRLIASLVAGALLLCQSVAWADDTEARSKTLVVASFGGGLDQVYKKVFEPFEKEYGVTIRWTPSSAAENLAKLKATKAKPEYDVALVENFILYAGAVQGLFEPVDESIVTHYRDLYPQVRPLNNLGVPFGLFYQGIFYRQDEFTKRNWPAPEHWSDLFDPRYCDQIGMLTPSVSDGLRFLLILADGQTKRMPEAIARLATLKKCIPVLEPSAPKLEEKVQLGEYTMGVMGSIRAIPLMQRGYPIKFVLPSEGTVAGYSAAAAVKGAPNPKMAQAFLNWFLRPESQQQLMKELFYTPTNRTVTVPDDMKKLGILDSEGIKGLVPVDEEAIYKNRAAWIRQTERAMAQ